MTSGKSFTEAAQLLKFSPFTSGFSRSRTPRAPEKDGSPPNVLTLIGILLVLCPADEQSGSHLFFHRPQHAGKETFTHRCWMTATLSVSYRRFWFFSKTGSVSPFSNTSGILSLSCLYERTRQEPQMWIYVYMISSFFGLTKLCFRYQIKHFRNTLIWHLSGLK